jgi:inactive STAND
MINEENSFISAKRKYREILLQQYAAAYEELSSNLDQSQHPVINAKIQLLEKKILEVDNEIKYIECNSPNTDAVKKSKIYRESFADWEQNLHRIDFSKVNRNLAAICTEIEDSEGAALFLLKNSNVMGGKWCVQKIIKHVQDLGNWYPPIEFSFSSRPTISHTDFLYDAANKFEIKIDQVPEQQIINNLIDKIYLVLTGGGNIFMIQIDIPYLDANSTFLDWFVNCFWCPLVKQMPFASGKSPLVKIFAVITVRGAVHKQCLPDTLVCKKPPFANDRILEMPLQKWEEKDICKWLIKFSGLMLPAVGMSILEVELMAKTIYQVTEGRPIDVYDELMNTMTSKVN